MKTANIQLTESDAQALVIALELLPTIDMDIPVVQQSINNALCDTCIEKIINVEPTFSANEIRIIYCALAVMEEVIQGKHNVPKKEQQLYSQYIFNINKLLPIFDDLLPEY